MSLDSLGLRPPRPRTPHLSPAVITYRDEQAVRDAYHAVLLVKGLITSGILNDVAALQPDGRSLNGLTAARREQLRDDVRLRHKRSNAALRDALLVVIERHVRLSPVGPPNPASHPPSDGCATWWRTPDDVTHTCSLDGQHRSPHVNYVSGEVRLGHEPGLAHVPYDLVEVMATDVLRALEVRPVDVYALSVPIRALWHAQHADAHDHLTCGWCPQDVW